jgi:hypothetical protein
LDPCKENQYKTTFLFNVPPLLENRVLRRIFGPKRSKVTEEWRKLHNQGLHDM